MTTQKYIDSELLMPLRSHLGRDLFWSQPKTFVPWWELRAGHTLIATLEGSAGLWGRFDLRFADQAWELRRSFAFIAGIDAARPGDAYPVLKLRFNMFRQERFESLMGDYITCRPANVFAYQWGFVDEEGRLLMDFMAGRGEFRLNDFFRFQSRVHIEPRAFDRTDLALLVGLGWTLFMFFRYHR
jgi:hypothetical protein